MSPDTHLTTPSPAGTCSTPPVSIIVPVHLRLDLIEHQIADALIAIVDGVAVVMTEARRIDARSIGCQARAGWREHCYTDTEKRGMRCDDLSKIVTLE